jgi:hypothetical protein
MKTETLIMTADQNGSTIQTSPAAEISIERVGLKAGLITCTSLIIYFMIMKYFNFMNSAIAWSLNFIILWAGIIFSYHYYRSKTILNVNYIQGLILGGITTGVCVVPFVFFIYIYFSVIDTVLLQLLKNNLLFMGEQITPVTAAGSTMVEGLCSGVIISFIMMQYLRSGFRRAGSEAPAHG